MSYAHYQHRYDLLTARLTTLAPRLDRVRQSVQRLEAEEVPAGATANATAAARAAQLSAARSMASTLAERERQIQVAIEALRAEMDDE